jgi:hypothetical protein
VGEIVFLVLLLVVAALRWRDRLRFRRPVATAVSAS